MIDVDKIVKGAICRFRDVSIKEVNGGIKVYRKTIKDENIIVYAKGLLVEALEALGQLEAREYNLVLEAKEGKEITNLYSTIKYLNGWKVGHEEDYIAFAQDKIKQCYAILNYVGIVNENDINKFSNFMLR